MDYENYIKLRVVIKAIRERQRYLEDAENTFNIWIITILVTKTEKIAHNIYYIWKRKKIRNIIQVSFPKMNKAINVKIERILCDPRGKSTKK